MRDGDTDAVPGLKPEPFVLRIELGAENGFEKSDVWVRHAARRIGTSPNELRGPIARTAVSSVDGAFALFERGVGYNTLAQLEAAIGNAVQMKAICVLVYVPPFTSYMECAAVDDAASSARAQFSVPVLYIKNRDGAALLTALRSHGRSGYAGLLPKVEEQSKGGSIGSILGGWSLLFKAAVITPESQLFSLLRELDAQPVTEGQIQLALGYIGRWEADGAELQQLLICVVEALEKRCQAPARAGDLGLLLIAHKFRELAVEMAGEAAVGPERHAGKAACSKLDKVIKACVLSCDFGVRLRLGDESGGRGFALTVFVNRTRDDHPEWADELSVCALDVLSKSSEMTELCIGLWMRLVTSPLASAAQWETDLRFFSNKALTASGRYLRADQVYFFLEACAPYALPAAVHALAIAVKPLVRHVCIGVRALPPRRRGARRQHSRGADGGAARHVRQALLRRRAELDQRATRTLPQAEVADRAHREEPRRESGSEVLARAAKRCSCQQRSLHRAHPGGVGGVRARRGAALRAA
ncbi:hypothetical protein T492DRAFT_444040 [Pavlovales sp. CCMP2436]|nr:hypothetical protein T492DRAFT_444040 [Pavlovales sp. CCMP2436]